MLSLLRDCGCNNIVAQFVFIINYQFVIINNGLIKINI